jgi:uncharacterized protein YjbI with pentapeptide repeats
MRGADDDSRRREPESEVDIGSGVAGVPREPTIQAPSVLHEPSIRPLEQRKIDLIGRQPWHSGQNGRVEWNSWANDVRQLWERLSDIGDVATAAIGRAAALARVRFNEDFDAEADFSNFVFPGDVVFAGVKFSKGAVFSGAIFHGRASFVARGEGDKVDGCEFNGAAKFNSAIFLDDVDFSDVRFGPTATFEAVKFHGRVVFEDAQFNRGALFAGRAEFGLSLQGRSPASFVRARFGQGGFGDKTDFSGAQFHDAADFSKAEFVGGKTRVAPVHFDGSTFHREATFVETQFGTAANDGAIRRCHASFEGVLFTVPPDFSRSIHRSELVLVASLLNKGASFNEIRFEESVRVPARGEPGSLEDRPGSDFPLLSFRSSVFCRGLQWPSARVPVALDFFGAEFQERVVLSRCTLGAEHSRGIDPTIGHNFEGAKFLEDVDATGTEWNLVSKFSGTSFKKRVHLDGSVFKGGVDFTTTEFSAPLSMCGDRTLIQGDLRFDQSTFKEICDFSKMQVEGVTYYGGCTFSRAATFEGCRLSGGGVFDDSEFSRAVRFTGAVFGKPGRREPSGGMHPRISFERATFQQMAYFDRAEFHAEPDFSGARSASSFSFGESKFFDTLPRLSSVSLETPPHLDSIDLRGEATKVSREGQIVKGRELRKEVSSRYLVLALLARRAGDADRDREFSRHSQNASPDRGIVVRTMSALFRLVSDSGYSFGKPAFGLLLTALVVFPAIYLTYYGGDQRNLRSTATKLASNWDLPCIAGEGSAVLMAIHKSLKSTIPGFGDTDGRQEQISACLYGVSNARVTYPVIVLSPILQALSTLAWLSLLGLALRNHLKVR